MSICIQCGLEFTPKKSTTGKFCSAQCWYDWPGRLDTRICAVCEEEFHVPKSRPQKTCSIRCANQSKRTPRVTDVCLRCGVELKHTAHKRVRYCSKSCAMKQRRRVGQRDRPDGSTQPHTAGYVLIKQGSQWKLEHRAVMEEVLGRTLEPHERVHHKNGKRADNRPENLELWKVTAKDPAGVRATDYHCAGCRC